MLDALVEFVLHLGLPWVREDAAVAERTRAKLRPTLKPAKHVALGEQPRRIGANVAAGRSAGLEPNEPGVQRLPHRPFRVLDTQVGMLHDEGPRLLLDRQVTIVGAANGDAIVAGGGLNPDVLEAGFAQDAAIGDAVEPDTAGDAEVSGAGRLA